MQYKITTSYPVQRLRNSLRSLSIPETIMKNEQTKNKKSFKSILIVILVVLTSAMIFTSNKLKVPYKIYTVESGSMQPTLHQGDLIVTKESVTYTSGDIVTFAPATATKKYQAITHRIIDTKEINGTTLFTTKGDFNKAADIDPLYKNQIIGRFVFKIPLVGYFISFLRTMLGFIIIIVIPTTILIYQEILGILNVIQTKREQKIET